MRWGWVLPLVAAAGCDKVLGLDEVHDAAPDAPPCMSTLTPGDYSIHATVFDGMAPSLSIDQTLMYATIGGKLSYSRYAGAWSAPTPVPSLDDPGYFEDRATLSYDAGTIYFTRHPSGTMQFDLPYVATRIGDEEWAPAAAVAFPSELGGTDVG